VTETIMPTAWRLPVGALAGSVLRFADCGHDEFGRHTITGDPQSGTCPVCGPMPRFLSDAELGSSWRARGSRRGAGGCIHGSGPASEASRGGAVSEQAEGKPGTIATEDVGVTLIVERSWPAPRSPDPPPASPEPGSPSGAPDPAA
jgi:hypothetical protein